VALKGEPLARQPASQTDMTTLLFGIAPYASSAAWSSNTVATALYLSGWAVSYGTARLRTWVSTASTPHLRHGGCFRSWCKQAAEQGHQLAMFNLGTFFHHGQGLDKDLTQAVRWYRAAAEAGEMRAANNLGVCYEKGHGLEQDYDQAVCWYRRVRAHVGVVCVLREATVRASLKNPTHGAKLRERCRDGVGD
jgi:hypothetical protein